MIYRTLEEVKKSQYNVNFGHGESRRFLLEKDGMGFTLTDTFIEAGTESNMQYNHHLEACYCIEGSGELEVSGKTLPLEPGVMYALNDHERHIVRAKTKLRFICVFKPALSGLENHKHTADGTSGY